MNRERRKRLQAAFDKIAEVQEIITDVRDEEQEAFENLPENFQYGEKGEEMQGYIEIIFTARHAKTGSVYGMKEYSMAICTTLQTGVFVLTADRR